MSGPRLSDEALCERMLGGDLSAFDELYERHERHVLGFIRTQVRDAAEAEDILHDAFISVLRESRSGRAVQAFRPWLFQVARHLCLNRGRARQRGKSAAQAMEQQAARDEVAGTPLRTLEELEAGRRLRTALSELPSTLAELYRLRASGLSYEEVGRVLEVPLGTVKSRMHELVRRLRLEVSE